MTGIFRAFIASTIWSDSACLTLGSLAPWPISKRLLDLVGSCQRRALGQQRATLLRFDIAYTGGDNILWLPESNGYPTRTILGATLRRVAGRVARGHQRAGQGQLTPKPSGPDRRHAPSEITIGLIILLLVVLVASTITLFLSESEDRWTCTVYPDKKTTFSERDAGRTFIVAGVRRCCPKRY